MQLLEPGLLREEQLTRAAERLRRGEAPFNVDEWAQSSAAFLVYGDFEPLHEDVEDGSLWGRSVIDESFRFVGIYELAVVAQATGMPALMRDAESLLRHRDASGRVNYESFQRSIVGLLGENHERASKAHDMINTLSPTSAHHQHHYKKHAKPKPTEEKV